MLNRSLFLIMMMLVASTVMSFHHSLPSTLSRVSRSDIKSTFNERRSGNSILQMNVEGTNIQIPLGDGFKSVECNFKPLFANSMFFVTDYQVPFNINIEKPPKGFPAPIVTKEGAGGEQPGDVLRALTCWSQGFSAAGVTSDIAMFAGNIKWRKSVFDATGAPWSQVVDAFLSNTSERSKTVTLVFEREVEAPASEA